MSFHLRAFDHAKGSIMSQGPGNPYAIPQQPTGGPVGTPDDGKLTTVDWLVCILCSGIGCIIGIIRLVQGKKNAGMMIGMSILFGVMWNISVGRLLGKSIEWVH